MTGAGGGSAVSVLRGVFEWFGDNRGDRVMIMYDGKEERYLWASSHWLGNLLEGRDKSRLVVVYQGGYWELVRKVCVRVGAAMQEDNGRGL